MTPNPLTMAQLPEELEQVFTTSDSNSPYWRRLMAFKPCESITLKRREDLPRLLDFLDRHAHNLCAGYLSYDLGLYMMGLSSSHDTLSELAHFHAYDDWFEKRDGKWISNHDTPPPPVDPKDEPDSADLDLKLEMSRDAYANRIQTILDYIKAGDLYQLNLTQTMSGKTGLSPRMLFQLLSSQHPAEHGCYLEAGELSIHSLSPELFLHHKEGILTTEPIKGTRPRDPDPGRDAQQLQDLMESEKEQAELFMITDLLRNDMGKVCKVGSISLDAVKEAKQLPRVWHTASRISGNLRNDLSPMEALLSMFPGGSITGCPKERSMEVIDELELSNRGIYTGSFGYLHPDGDMSFNIAIRTLVQRGSALSLGTGGGITIDSRWEQEWDELLVKASNFQDLKRKQGE